MKNEVKINIPLFIGLILLVASITAILVSGIKMVSDYIIEKNKEVYNGFKQIDNIINDQNVDEENSTNSELLNQIDTNNI